MLFLRLWNYIRGYVIIYVEGYFLEKFLNICTNRQILLWNVTRRKNCSMTMKVSIKAFKLLRPVARKTKCRVRIMNKRGLPFIAHRYKKRKAFVFGLFVFVGIFFLLTSFIWDIEINGNKKIDSQELKNQLSELGVATGKLKYGVNADRIANNLMLANNRIGWVSVVVKGTKVKVNITERTEVPEIVDKSKPCDIVSAADGVITSLVVKEGIEKVKVGDTVTKGQLLIAGTVPSKIKDAKPLLVHASGTVKARTWYEGTAPVEMKTTEKQRTGNEKSKYYLSLLGKRLSIWPGKVKFEDYEKVEIVKKISIGDNLVLPFALHIDQYYENNIVENEISEEDAKNAAAEKALEAAKEQIPEKAEIKAKKTEFALDANGNPEARIVIECTEDIVLYKAIGG